MDMLVDGLDPVIASEDCAANDLSPTIVPEALAPNAPEHLEEVRGRNADPAPATLFPFTSKVMERPIP